MPVSSSSRTWGCRAGMAGHQGPSSSRSWPPESGPHIRCPPAQRQLQGQRQYRGQRRGDGHRAVTGSDTAAAAAGFRAAVTGADPAGDLARDEILCGSGRPARGFRAAQFATIVTQLSAMSPQAGRLLPQRQLCPELRWWRDCDRRFDR